MTVTEIKSFQGLSLHPCDALKNIASFIEVAGLLSVITDEEYRELGDAIFDLSKKYAEAAYIAAQENNQ